MFAVDDWLQRLSDLDGQLETFAAAVDFEMFRADLMQAPAYSDGSRGGRPPLDPAMMFKFLVGGSRPGDLIAHRVADRLAKAWIWTVFAARPTSRRHE